MKVSFHLFPYVRIIESLCPIVCVLTKESIISSTVSRLKHLSSISILTKRDNRLLDPDDRYLTFHCVRGEKKDMLVPTLLNQN